MSAPAPTAPHVYPEKIDGATANWDAVIITHAAFRFIPVPSSFERGMIEEQITACEAIAARADDGDRITRKRLEAMKAQFLKEAKANKVFPIGAGIWLRIHPEDRIKTPYTSWQFDSTTTRMPEFTAPGLGRESNHVVIDAELGENASGVLYALGGASGGDDGQEGDCEGDAKDVNLMKALIADCDWVIEAVTENLAIKQALFANVIPHLKADAILSTNTSGIPIA